MATPNSAITYSLAELSNELAQAVETGGKAVVSVHGRPRIPSSGILWRPGVVVTTDHTLKRHEDITVTLADGSNVPASPAGRDAGTDIAVLRIADTSAGAAKTTDAASLKAGHIVLAIGRRGEHGPVVGFGVVSALGGAWRTWRGGQIDRFIRPDVSIYHGFSGGALVDAAGLVVGLNTSALARGSAITIPASSVSRVVEEILTQGHVRRGYLGVGLHPVEVSEGRTGLIILSLEPNGPAARAGVFVGDVLVALDGADVADTDDVQAHLGGDRIGKTVTASLIRGGAPVTLEIVPAERRPEGGC